ncbi:piggyBac transposable element-derived protein 4-like [Gymnodraco acuticeps]|uniref:PiggyBac transposable element-derived protein 4-like n=1 Tax=Gymnodraco acuticeps TaxID=8218 RepID=A0A6P8UH63_GYMAC|nr:piggyBac transposable element-derived protein 4-like [Gymnodraco acuticeps]
MSNASEERTALGYMEYILEEDHDSEIEENVSEDEDYLEVNDEDYDYDQSNEETDIRPDATFMSKNCEIQWSSSPNGRQATLSAANIMKAVPGPTRMAVSRVTDIKSAFELVISNTVLKIVLDMTNLEGRRVYGEEWKELDEMHLHAYLGLLILAGVYKSKDESTASLWDADTGRNIFRATMSLGTFHIFSRVIRFDNRDTRAGRRERDKLAAIRTVWDKWVERLPLLYNPGPNVTVDERLVAFRGRCPFKQYMPSKPAKYGLKIWAACDANSSYALNLQVYTGKPVGGAPEWNQGMRVVLDMAKGLRGHNITCDNFFTSYNLGQELLKRKLTMVGTVRKNRTELPAEMLVIKNRVPQSSKRVLNKELEVIQYNNKTKSGVDTMDQMVRTYTCKRRTQRKPMVLWHNVLDVATLNAYFTAQHPDYVV